jgi:hypothetical protein
MFIVILQFLDPILKVGDLLLLRTFGQVVDPMVHAEDVVSTLAGHLDALWVDVLAPRPVKIDGAATDGNRGGGRCVPLATPLRKTLASVILLLMGRSPSAERTRSGSSKDRAPSA